jgi:hypothetical protein
MGRELVGAQLTPPLAGFYLTGIKGINADKIKNKMRSFLF